MHIEENYPLKNLTTFGIGGSAKYFIDACRVDDVIQVLHFMRRMKLPLFILGGGSNVLVNDNGFPGIVLKMNLKGVEILEEDAQSVVIKSAAGEIWDDVVDLAVKKGWWGIENLSHIPGSVGALAIQNVGAYGQEACDVIESLEVWDRTTGDRRIFSNQECQFGYRSSVFNSAQKGRYIILSTFLKLKKNGSPNLNYRALRDCFEKKHTPTLQGLRAAVIHFRQVKLPDPQLLGNAGSFFKNLLLSSEEFERLCLHMKHTLGNDAVSKIVPFRRTASGRAIKVSTALILDLCGLKGLQIGGAAIYHKHPLVVVNATGNATAHDVMGLLRAARQKVYRITGLEVIPEPNFIGFNEEELQYYLGLEETSSS